jgi:hypothetical protein
MKPGDKRSEAQRKSGSEIETVKDPTAEGGFVSDETTYERNYSQKGFLNRSQGNKLTFNPLAIDEFPQPSPEQERLFEIDLDKGVGKLIREARAIGPSVRQQTQAEILNLVILGREIGSNPFSVRRLPFSIMRDMASDPNIAFALYYIETPLINAQWSCECEDAQLAAAVDSALRPINSDLISKFCQVLSMGYQPMVKRWKLGQLDGVYRDKTSESPDKDLKVWPSKNVDALLWKTFLALPPENCLPRWNEMGNFNGFMYSPVPIPNPMMLGVAQTYGPQVLSGYPIPLEWSMWIVNERFKQHGSLYGSPRSKRAYRFWWSYWFRWALSDRSYENKADPAKIVYYPTMVAEALDVNNPNSETPQSLQNKAIQSGNSVRSGSTVAYPGDFMVNEEGKTMNQRQWEIKYLEGGENFTSLEQCFMSLGISMIKAMFLPEQAFVDATMAGQTSSQRYISAQMGEIYQESQQQLSNEYDEYINKYMIPEFISANFPDKIDIPCKRVTRGYGARNSETTKQILTLIGQKNPENLPIDVRQLLREEGYPLTSEAQQKLNEKKHQEAAENAKPPVMLPTKKEGVQGQNAGVEKTETGEHVYYQVGQELYLGADSLTNLGMENRSFVDSLPKIPAYEDAAVRTAALQMRKLFMDRYKNQITSLANQIRNKTILKLAEPAEPQEKPGFGAGAARIAAKGAVAAWLADQMITLPAVSSRLKDILGRIVARAGNKELKLSGLDPSVYDSSVLDKWVEKYVEENLKLMDNTTQDVFKDFLEKQLQQNSHPDIVAQALEDNFADMPTTYSTRAVRAQTRDAYNQGMLQAGIDAGIDQVIAHDASSGTNLNTDSKCIKRNGRIFSLKDAQKETEHPNGTLHYSYLTTSNLSVKVTDDIPEKLELTDNMLAGYDYDTETLYIKKNAEGLEQKYLLALSENLSYR